METEKVKKNLQDAINKWSADLYDKPLKTIIHAAIILWITKQVYKWFKD